MGNLLKVISGMVVGAGLLLAPELASAQDLGVRGEAGVAVPLTGPQVNHFDVGGDFAIKGVVGLGSYVDIGPMVSVLALPGASGGPDGAAWGLGGSLRLKRPHDATNTGTGAGAVSPWVDADLQYIRTGTLDRAGASVGAGLAFPTNDDRDVWIGPYVRYLDVVQGNRIGFDNTDAHTFIVGVSLELGPRVAKKAAPRPIPAPPPPVVVVVHKDPPPVIHQDIEMELRQIIQFAWDSPKLDAVATAQLEAVIKKLEAAKSFGAIKVEGHASSEGQVEHNSALSNKRARAVVDFLVAHGVAKDKVSASGFGSSVAVATNKTASGRVLNRRAQFVVKFVIVKESK